jgi:hypothetical protein
MISQHIQDRAVDTLAVTPAVVAVSFNIVQVNQYLQAAAYIVAILSSLCAAYYYLRKANKP